VPVWLLGVTRDFGDPMLMPGEPAVNEGRSSCTFHPRTHPMVMRRSVLIGLTMIGSWLPAESVFAAEPQNIDKDFFQQSTAIGALSLLASRLALTQLTVPKLKRFADLEVAEQETVWSVVMSLTGSGSPADKTEIPTNEGLEGHLVPLGRSILMNIRQTQDGTNLARDYFLLEVNVHQQLLRLQEDYLGLAPAPRWLAVAKLMDNTTREHLALLNEIKTDTDSGKGTARPGR
jgi:putative membrane protein